MSNRRKSLELEEVVYTGEVIDQNTNQNDDLEKLKVKTNHELNMKKAETATELVKVGSKIVDILSVRENSKAKVRELNAQIKQFKVETERELGILKEGRKKIQSKGETVSKILRELTPILMQKDLDVDSKKMAIELFEKTILEVIAENE